MRIKGTVGDWPVDLQVELDETDWRRLAAGLSVASPERAAAVSSAPAPAVAAPLAPGEQAWQAVLDLLREAGQLEGTALLAACEGLAGSAVAGKRLLVRLRHAPQVQVESAGETPLYRWRDGGAR